MSVVLGIGSELAPMIDANRCLYSNAVFSSTGAGKCCICTAVLMAVTYYVGYEARSYGHLIRYVHP
jgi:hypothetical protein